MKKLPLFSSLIILGLTLFLHAMAGEASAKDIALTLTVPDTTWTLAIEEVREVDGELWVLAAAASNPDMAGAQVISEVKASLRLDVPDLPVKYFVSGKTWNWENTEPYVFINDRRQIEKELAGGKLLYPAER